MLQPKALKCNPPPAHLAGVWPRPIWRPGSGEGVPRGGAGCSWGQGRWDPLTPAYCFPRTWRWAGIPTMPPPIPVWVPPRGCVLLLPPARLVPGSGTCASICARVPAHACGSSARELASWCSVSASVHGRCMPAHACTWLCLRTRLRGVCRGGSGCAHTYTPGTLSVSARLHRLHLHRHTRVGAAEGCAGPHVPCAHSPVTTLALLGGRSPRRLSPWAIPIPATATLCSLCNEAGVSPALTHGARSARVNE